MKKRSLFICGLCLQLLCHSQSGLYINGTFTIKSNTIVAIDGLSLTPSVPYTIMGLYSLVRNATLAHPSLTPSIKRAFQWNAAPALFTGSIEFYYDESELNGLSESELTLNVNSGTQWQAYMSGAIRNPAANFVTTPVNNLQLNEISLAAEAHPLPLKWGSLAATRINKTARIEWLTYSEDQTSFFQIEYSIDGLRWITIDSPIPAANTPGSHQYQFYDSTVSASKTFYRIKQVDRDGQSSYSPVVQVTAVQNQLAISVYPNPATQQVFVQSVNVPLKMIRLFSTNGQLIRTTAVHSKTTYVVSLEEVPKGMYILQAQRTDGTTGHLSITKN
jgi:hypothetical protein